MDTSKPKKHALERWKVEEERGMEGGCVIISFKRNMKSIRKWLTALAGKALQHDRCQTSEQSCS